MMNKERSCSLNRFLVVLTLTSLVAPLLVGCTLRASGEELVQSECTRCHTLAPIEVTTKTRNEWEDTVYNMIEHGANLSESQVTRVVDYLVEHHGPEAP
jgi:hypothetical protein